MGAGVFSSAYWVRGTSLLVINVGGGCQFILISYWMQ